MPAFTKETAREMAVRANQVRRQKKKARENYVHPPASPFEDVHERNARFWGIIAAIDKRLGWEASRPRPNGELMRDLATTRRILLSQADGPKAAAPRPPDRAALADPELPASES